METQIEKKESVIQNEIRDKNDQQHIGQLQKRFSLTEKTKFLSRSKINKQSFIQSRNTSYLQSTIKNSNQSDIIKLLMKQNEDLKQQIIELKFSQFYQFDQKKLKGLIGEVQKLKEKLKYYRQELQKTLIEKDFIQRSYKKMKTYCEQLIKEKEKQKSEKLFVTVESTLSPMIENSSIHHKSDKQREQDTQIATQAQKTCTSSSFAKFNNANNFYVSQGLKFSKKQQKQKDEQITRDLAKNFRDFSPIRPKNNYELPSNDSLRKVKSSSRLNSQSKGYLHQKSKDKKHVQTPYRFKR